MWWAGVPAPPARLATAVLPCLAVLLALAWQHLGGISRLVATGALAWSVSIAAIVVFCERGALVWNIRDAQALWLEWLNPVVNLPRGWPSFFWRLTPPVVSTELPFALHAAVWVAALALSAFLIWRLAAKASSRGAATIAASVVLAGATLSVQAGWWVNRTRGIDAAESQLAAITAMEQGRSAVRLRPFSVSHPRSGDGTFEIVPREAPRFRPDVPAAFFARVPAGIYTVVIRQPRPVEGVVTIRAGGVREPLMTRPIRQVGQEQFELRLDSPVSSLVFDFGAASAAEVVLRR
jgi:hypothetical protein